MLNQVIHRPVVLHRVVRQGNRLVPVTVKTRVH